MNDKKFKICGIYGVSGVGKSTCAHLTLPEFPDYDCVATDNLLAINRMLNPSNPILQQSSYTSWKRFGEYNTSNLQKGFQEYRKTMNHYLNCVLERARDQEVGMIIEGIHIEPELFYSFENSLDINLFLLYVKDKDMHKERIAEKCDYRPSLLKRLDENFLYVRELQDILLKEAKDFSINVINNENKSKETIESIVKGLR
tara:strand:+ start:2278 stop:2877 length:600 start_codon:yes stop_codon:yes gene_type:complete